MFSQTLPYSYCAQNYAGRSLMGKKENDADFGFSWMPADKINFYKVKSHLIWWLICCCQEKSL